MPSATCLRCRRPLEEPGRDGDLVLALDGPPMLAALREVDREQIEPAALEVVEELEAALCPACGRAR